MGKPDTFLHAKEKGLPTLVRAGRAHVQFETIPPLGRKRALGKCGWSFSKEFKLGVTQLRELDRTDFRDMGARQSGR